MRRKRRPFLPCNKNKRKWLQVAMERFRLGNRKNFFIKRIIKHWNRLPREGLESPPLKVFERHVVVALEDMV